MCRDKGREGGKKGWTEGEGENWEIGNHELKQGADIGNRGKRL